MQRGYDTTSVTETSPILSGSGTVAAATESAAPGRVAADLSMRPFPVAGFPAARQFEHGLWDNRCPSRKTPPSTWLPRIESALMTDEMILVVRRALFDELGAFQGLNFEIDRYLPALLARENNFFTPRPPAETDPSLKQIIPYVLLVHEGRVLHYVRGKKAGEQRLVAKGSIGIGGHMNEHDEGLFALDRAAYDAAVQREVGEELKLGARYTESRGRAAQRRLERRGARAPRGGPRLSTRDATEVQKGEAMITELQFLDRQATRRPPRRDGNVVANLFRPARRIARRRGTASPMNRYGNLRAHPPQGAVTRRRLGHPSQGERARVVFRVERELVPVEAPKPTEEWITEVLDQIVPEHLREQAGAGSRGGFRLRARPASGVSAANVFQQRGTFVMALRLVQDDGPQFRRTAPADDLAKHRRKRRAGSCSSRAPPAAGKSTTLAAMIEHINATARKHIITLEDPIEYLFEDKQSVIEQREIGLDTATFASGLHNVLRQDPDVIVIGEMRDAR